MDFEFGGQGWGFVQCLYKFPKPPSFIGVFFVFLARNMFTVAGMNVFFDSAKVEKT